MTSLISHKIKPEHLSRKAIIYLRQSTERQVARNKESQALQYALQDRAAALGFKTIKIIDTDLGASAAMGAAMREGFHQLVAEVAMGQVGIILSREVSRFSRTDKDWCQLFEVCQLFDTLVGDSDQVYDLSLMDDQLIFGIKGTLSVVELKVLKLRMLEGQENKARRGELYRKFPPGYLLDGKCQMVKDPNRRVQEAIKLVFQKFREIWSIRQTYKWFHDQKVELPVNRIGGKMGQIGWQLPTLSLVSQILKNPFYAGAYIYGLRKNEIKLVNGRLIKKTVKLKDAHDARVFIRDHHEEYISYAEYEENQKMIRRNAICSERDETVAGVRKGHGLFSGLLRCQRCGRKLHVRYWGKSGTAARYLCKGDFATGGQYCLGFGGATTDRMIAEEVLRVISPLGIQASIEAARQWETRDEERRQAQKRQMEQLRYEERRAFEQYNEVDPRHRLVAAELELRWNRKLEELEQCQEALSKLKAQQVRLNIEEEQRIKTLGEDFSLAWNDPHCSMELKKKLVRTLIEEIIVALDDKTQVLHFIIHWKGGCHTTLECPKPRSAVGRKTCLEDIDIIRRMAVRYGDNDIARVLNKLGRRTGKGNRWNQVRVSTARKTYGIAGHKRTPRDKEIISLGQAVKEFGVSDTTFRRLAEKGLLKFEQIAPWAPWEIKRTDLETEPIRSILLRVKETKKLVFIPITPELQQSLFE